MAFGGPTRSRQFDARERVERFVWIGRADDFVAITAVLRERHVNVTAPQKRTDSSLANQTTGGILCDAACDQIGSMIASDVPLKNLRKLSK